jgi:putative redox protein
MKITLRRVNEQVHLVGENDEGNTVHIDGAEKIGGEGAGFRPMQLLLAALGSCATMDLVPILAKKRQNLEDLAIEVTGEREGDGVPSPFRSIHLHFRLVGSIDPKQAERSVELAVEKYCSVAETLKPGVEITHSYELVPSDSGKTPEPGST